MKCRYDTREKCTEQCKKIDTTCAWMKNETRRARVQQGKKEDDKIGEIDTRTKTDAAAGERKEKRISAKL